MNDKPLRIVCVEETLAKAACQELVEKRGAILVDEHPDLLIHSCFDPKYLTMPALVKLSIVGENVFPDFNIDDYAVSHVRDQIGGRNFYMPYAIWELWERPNLPPLCPSDAKRPFAIFVAYNDWNGAGAVLRKQFAELCIQNYKHVDCPGRVLHNIDIPELGERYGKRIDGKRNVLGRYKFNICFENSNTDGYITEKIVDAFLTNTVPIYWGSEGNLDPFPKEACICANDFPTLEALLERVREVDENNDLYLSILSKNPFRQANFWNRVIEWREQYSRFLLHVHDQTQAYKEDSFLKPCRGKAHMSALGLAMKGSGDICPIFKRGRSIRHAVCHSIRHLHFLRPGALPDKCCPFKAYDNFRSL